MPDPKDRLRTVLEEAMEDVAMLMADDDAHKATQAQKLLEVRQRIATVWKMADLGAVPEFQYELRGTVVRAS